jgi:hypothetical protein
MSPTVAVAEPISCHRVSFTPAGRFDFGGGAGLYQVYLPKQKPSIKTSSPWKNADAGIPIYMQPKAEYAAVVN